ncbi:uncharacterized protein LOC126738744 [Anthonomus grandis grandis]|uniref:uncharacterized protein LOC126738744 n=1 Tax=Anthonomus grandis grandis TaxID=2921223 RepID=UPI0021655DD7|nr:uncharacterized protein LOC126738744 [Anthonomus grandis grandis]
MPRGTVCSVATCKSNSKKAKEKGENIMFLRFLPKNPNIQREWVRKYARKDKWKPIEKRLCSLHFKSEDYHDEMQARLLNLQPRMLKTDAIPSLFLPSSVEKPVGKRTQRMLRKEREEKVEILLQETIIKTSPIIVVENQPETLTISDVPSTSMETDADIWKKKWEELEQENVILRKQIEDFRNKDNTLRAQILQLEKQIKQDQVQFEEKVIVAFLMIFLH